MTDHVGMAGEKYIVIVPPQPDRDAGDEYARAYEAGALAALDWLNDNYPDLEAAGEDCPSPTMAAAEHIGGVIDVLLGRRGV